MLRIFPNPQTPICTLEPLASGAAVRHRRALLRGHTTVRIVGITNYCDHCTVSLNVHKLALVGLSGLGASRLSESNGPVVGTRAWDSGGWLRRLGTVDSGCIRAQASTLAYF